MTRREIFLVPFAAAAAPQNTSYLLRDIPGVITPSELFFVRDHFEEPELSLSSWKLSVEGRVAQPFDRTISDLLESRKVKLEATLECAGNAAGGPSVSNGVWEGVSLRGLLEQAKPAPGATHVLLEGADQGQLRRDSTPSAYCQLVPIAECLRPESLVAFKLNDQLLPKRNGFPARAIFPGSYAMNSVKWLRRIVVIGPGDPDRGFRASGMNQLYTRVTGAGQGARVADLQVKSAIAWPAVLPDEAAQLPAGRLSVWGFAWTGNSLIQAVELSADGGKSWRPATLDSPPRRFTWVRWRCPWDATPGEHLLMSRASDLRGQRQPLTRQPDRVDAYELNWCAPTRCIVR